MTFSTTFFRACIPFLCCILAACGKKAPDGPSSATLERASLMQVAFPGWTANGPAQKQKLHVPEKFSSATDAKGKTVEEVIDEQIDPEFVVRLADDDATLIFSGHRLEDDGQPQMCQACGVEFGAVQFHRVDGNWYLTNRQDVFTEAGSMGSGVSPEIIKLAQHVFALKLGSYEMQSGDESQVDGLYVLTPTGPRDVLEKGVFQFANNEGMAVNCQEPSARDKNKPLPEEEQQECYHLDSKWHLDATGETPGDLTLQYAGFVRTQDKDKQYRYHHVDTKQIWHYQDGKYVAVSGTNPIDKIVR